MSVSVASGLDKLRDSGFSILKGSKIAVMSNQASVAADLQHVVDLVGRSSSCSIIRLFAPEHGFRGALQDMEKVEHTVDSRTGLPVISLYGSEENTLVPSAEHLSDIDILLFDLQDIGTRYYTFAQSLAYCMKACGKAGVKIVVLDRPNPIDGTTIEGPPLDKSCRSFCGYAPVPTRHALTMGELASLMLQGFGDGDNAVPPIDCELEVVEISGWHRSSYYDETGLPWVLPSPNMPTLETAIVYPGGCLFEATNLSEGRGTTKPFECIGAPFIDGFTWAEAVAKLGIGLDGARLRPLAFIPHYSKQSQTICGGVQIHVVDRDAFSPFRLSLALIYAAHELYPEQFAWRQGAYEFIDNVPAIDLLYGSSTFRNAVENNSGLDEVLQEMTEFETHFADARKEFLRY